MKVCHPSRVAVVSTDVSGTVSCPEPSQRSGRLPPHPKRDEGSGEFEAFLDSVSWFPSCPCDAAICPSAQPLAQQPCAQCSSLLTLQGSPAGAPSLLQPSLDHAWCLGWPCALQGKGAFCVFSEGAVDFLSAGQSPPAALELLGDRENQNVV